MEFKPDFQVTAFLSQHLDPVGHKVKRNDEPADNIEKEAALKVVEAQINFFAAPRLRAKLIAGLLFGRPLAPKKMSQLLWTDAFLWLDLMSKQIHAQFMYGSPIAMAIYVYLGIKDERAALEIAMLLQEHLRANHRLILQKINSIASTEDEEEMSIQAHAAGNEIRNALDNNIREVVIDAIYQLYNPENRTKEEVAEAYDLKPMKVTSTIIKPAGALALTYFYQILVIHGLEHLNEIKATTVSPQEIEDAYNKATGKSPGMASDNVRQFYTTGAVSEIAVRKAFLEIGRGEQSPTKFFIAAITHMSLMAMHLKSLLDAGKELPISVDPQELTMELEKGVKIHLKGKETKEFWRRWKAAKGLEDDDDTEEGEEGEGLWPDDDGGGDEPQPTEPVTPEVVTV